MTRGGYALSCHANALLFDSAHWCPPCRSFTPLLSEFYDQLKEEDENALEVIFASSDNDTQSFTSYFNDMPWTSIPFENSQVKDSLSTRFNIEGLPTFLVLNMADGSVVDTDARRTLTESKGNTSKAMKLWSL